MNIASNKDNNFLYDLPTSNDEGAKKKTDAQYSILAAKTMNATKLFQNMLETAIDSVADSKTGTAGSYSGVSQGAGARGAGDVAPNQLDSVFEQASRTYGVDKQLLLAVARTESNFTPSATSKSGAMGVMQLMPQTAAELGVKNAYDATDNIMGGAKLLSMLLSRYQGDKAKALAAYNAGGNRVDRYGGVPPEIQGYVNKVMSYYSQGIGISDQQLATAMQQDYRGGAASDGNYAATSNLVNNYQSASNGQAGFASGNISQKTVGFSQTGGSTSQYSAISSAVNSVSEIAGQLKASFAKFPEHQSYESFLEELAIEMKNDGQPSDARDAYEMLLANAKTAISRVRAQVAASDAQMKTFGMDEDELDSISAKSSTNVGRSRWLNDGAYEIDEDDDDIADVDDDDEEDEEDYDIDDEDEDDDE